MSTKQPEALRLAKELVLVHQGHADEGPSTFSEAAAELRRLNSVNADLLAVLQELCDMADDGDVVSWAAEWDKARAAIAKAKGES
jgi:hypothetical protein